MNGTQLNIECAGLINGQVLNVKGKGLGIVDRGKLEIELSYSDMPDGFNVIVSAMWTVCCSSPTFALERNGGLNMIAINNAHYRCERTFDFGPYGSYDYWFENRLMDSEMTARGTIRGNVHLPEISGIEESITEIMIPVGPQEIRSVARAAFILADGTSLPLCILGRYTRLNEGNWNSSVRDQVRKSYVTIKKRTELDLALEYATIIEAIRYPDFPAALPSYEATRLHA